LTFKRLHGVPSQKIQLFVNTAVRISNPIYPNILKIRFFLNEKGEMGDGGGGDGCT
jgi:hypothetical protein